MTGGTTALVDTLPTSDNGLDAVRKTLDLMVKVIRKYRSDQTTAETARNILTTGGRYLYGQPPGLTLSQAQIGDGIQDLRTQKRLAIKMLQNWVRDRIVYVYDPRDVEWVQTPPKTLLLGTGDCDDKIVLLLTMLESVGFDTELLGVGGIGQGWDPSCAPQAPGQLPAYSHVLGAVRYGPVTGRTYPWLDGWLWLETIVKNADPGYKPAGIRVIMPRRV